MSEPVGCAAPAYPELTAPAQPLLPSLTDLLTQIPAVLCLLLGPTHIVALSNPLAARVWGQPAAQLLGRPFLDTLPAAAVAGYAAACATAWQSGQAVVWLELPVVEAATSAAPQPVSYVTLSFHPFRSPAGDPMGLLLVAQDATPLVQARQQAEQAQAELVATNIGLADYVAELVLASLVAK